MGKALRAIPDNGNSLARKIAGVGILIVVDFHFLNPVFSWDRGRPARMFANYWTVSVKSLASETQLARQRRDLK